MEEDGIPKEKRTRIQTKHFKYTPYKCPRCGYETERKSSMKNHFQKKNACPITLEDIELSEEVKEYILNNRTYETMKKQLSSKSENITNQYQFINNFNINNQINSIVSRFDVSEKITKYLNFHNRELIDLDEQVENIYKDIVHNMENNKYRHDYNVKDDEIYRIIDKISKINEGEINSFNIYYNKLTNRIHIYISNEWHIFMIDDGIKRMFECITDYYLQTYECYLIRKLLSSNCLHSINYSNMLVDYYKFLACVSVEPYVQRNSDYEIMRCAGLDDENNTYDMTSFDLSSKYMELFYNISKELSASHIREVKQKIIKIINENTHVNIKQLDNIISQLVQIDESFREIIMAKYLEQPVPA